MLKLDAAYWVLALFLAGSAWLDLRARRWQAACFWGLLAVLFGGGRWALAEHAAGEAWPVRAVGAAVLALALLAPAVGRDPPAMVAAAQREASAERLGHRLFISALLIPGVTVLITLAGGYVAWRGVALFDPASRTLLGLFLASLLAVAVALALGRQRAGSALVEGRRLLDTLGWTALLPLVLAAIGAVLTASGVGSEIARLVGYLIPVHSRLACVLAYGIGMALFTVILGNAFAAFPVLAAGIGLPLLVHLHGANPAPVGALGMLCGYCGTLLTPMAANFNIVPVALLDLDDRWAVIRAQWPTALVLLAINLTLLYLFT